MEKTTPCKIILFLKKIEESLTKVSDRSEKILALVVKGLIMSVREPGELLL